ncbi:hypothetical protein KI387_035728, partial [Taxus chinensis]
VKARHAKTISQIICNTYFASERAGINAKHGRCLNQYAKKGCPTQNQEYEDVLDCLFFTYYGVCSEDIMLYISAID